MSRSLRALFVIPFLQQWNLVDVEYIKNFQKHLGDQNGKEKQKNPLGDSCEREIQTNPPGELSRGS